MEINEVAIENYPKPIFYESTIKILEQMTNKICKININGQKATGFFTKIPVDNKLIPVFITNYHVIDQGYLQGKKEIKVDIFMTGSKMIKIKDKIIYYNEKYDVTIIEVDENIEEIYEYLELDDNILNNNEINNYIGSSIYTLQYPCYHEKQKLSVSYGILKNKYEDKEYNFIHYCSTEFGSSGSPILNIYNNKVIGIHKQRSLNSSYNIGSFLYYSVKGFIDKYKGKNIMNNNNYCIMNNNNYIHSTTNENQNLIEFNKKYNLNLDIKDLNLDTLKINDKKIGNDILKYLCENFNLTGLKQLILAKNNISDIKILAKVNFEKLEILNIGFNAISNIDVFEKANFKELKQLWMSRNCISDITVLEKLKFDKLEIIDFNQNKISNIDVLERINLKELKELYLGGNNISDIKVLEKMEFEKLEKLGLNHNKITNIDILEKVDFKGLKLLYLGDNNISDKTILQKVKIKFRKLSIYS